MSAGTRASGQTSYGIAAGIVQLPRSYPGEYTTGLTVVASLGRGSSRPGLGLRVDGALARFPGQAVQDARGVAWRTHRIVSLTANAVYEIGRSATRPYVIAGVGYYNQNGYIANHNLGLNSGVGLRVGTGRVGAFLEGRVHNALVLDLSRSPIAAPRIVPVSVGITF